MVPELDPFQVEPVLASELNDELDSRTPLWAIKQSDESVSSSITVQADDELRLLLPANGIYRVELEARVSGATGGDLRAAWNNPADLTMHARFCWGLGSAVTTADDQAVRFQSPTFLTSQLGTGTTAGSPYREVLYVTTGASDADLQFEWAQVVSNGVATNVLAGSAVYATRLLS